MRNELRFLHNIKFRKFAGPLEEQLYLLASISKSLIVDKGKDQSNRAVFLEKKDQGSLCLSAGSEECPFTFLRTQLVALTLLVEERSASESSIASRKSCCCC